MKNAAQCAKKWTTLAKSLPEPPELDWPNQNDPLAILIQSFLLWETTSEKALAAYDKLMQSVEDLNDLRVSMPDETMGYIGSRYPAAGERCQRIRAVLRNIYLREHEVTLNSLQSEGKREVRKYIESLEGIVPFVSARVLLLGYDVHAIPIDEQLARLLVEHGVAHEEADCSEISAWLARQVKASEGAAVHRSLQAWVEKAGPATSKKTTTKKTTRKKTSKKKTAKAGAK